MLINYAEYMLKFTVKISLSLTCSFYVFVTVCISIYRKCQMLV